MAAEILVTHVSGKLARPPARFAKECVKLGRLHDNDVFFDEYAKKLSRYHAAVFTTEGVLYLKDMGSKNGTFVNGERLAEHRTIAPDDLVKLGDRGPILRFELVGEGEPGRPPTPVPARPRAEPVATSPAKGSPAAVLEEAVAAAQPRDEPARPEKKQVSKSTLLMLEDVIAHERVRMQRLLVVAALSALLVLALVAGGGLILHARSVDELREASRRDQDAMKARYESDLKKQMDDLARAIEERDRKLAEIREREGLSEAQKNAMLEATQKELADLRAKLAAQEKTLERRATEVPSKPQVPASWPEIVERYKESLFLCYGGTQEKGGIGTAFVVGKDGVLATNAHVVQFLKASAERYVIQNDTGAVFKLVDFKGHPDFNGTPQSPDVGLLKIDTGGQSFVPLPLASDEELRRLRGGTQLGTLGYPGELAQGYFASFDKTTHHFKGVLATFKDGWVSRMTNYKAEIDSFQASTLIQHSASLTGGTSGSPMFTADGKVVALNNASLDYEVVVQPKQGQKSREVRREKSAAEVSWAIRVDELRRFKERSGW